jgi:hypothetical protein
VDEPTRFPAGDPALARHRDAAVERDRDLERHERSVLSHPRPPRFVLLPRFEEVGDLDLQACGAEALGAATAALARIEGSDHHAGDPGLDHGMRTGRCRSVVRAGLEGDVEGPAAGALARSAQRMDLRVRLAPALVPPLPDDLSVACDDRADDGIGVRRTAAAFGQLQRPFETHPARPSPGSAPAGRLLVERRPRKARPSVAVVLTLTWLR